MNANGTGIDALVGYRLQVRNTGTRIQPKKMEAVVKELHGIPEVRTLQSVSGSFDLVALGVVGDVHQMDVLTDRIGAIDGVERTNTSIILSTKFER